MGEGCEGKRGKGVKGEMGQGGRGRGLLLSVLHFAGPAPSLALQTPGRIPFFGGLFGSTVSFGMFAPGA